MMEVINTGDRNLIESLRCSKSCGTYMSILNGLNKGKVWNDASEKVYRILWDCDEFNEDSKKTAQSQNLVFDYKYKVFWFEI